MKVIGKVDDIKYICEISHVEIEKFLCLYYNKMKPLKIGEEVDLGEGYEWWSNTKAALDETKRFFESHKKNINAITKAFTMEVKE